MPPDPRIVRTRRDVISAAQELFAEGGLAALTHASVAQRAGYTRSTIYTHWPRPVDLLIAAFTGMCSVRHPEQTGDLRTDVIADLAAYGDALANQHLDRLIATLVERAPSEPALDELLDTIAAEGGGVLRSILSEHEEVAAYADLLVPLLGGAVLYRVLFERDAKLDRFIERTVDLMLTRIPAVKHLPP